MFKYTLLPKKLLFIILPYDFQPVVSDHNIQSLTIVGALLIKYRFSLFGKIIFNRCYNARYCMILLTGLEYLTIELTIAVIKNVIIDKMIVAESFKEFNFYVSTLNFWHFWVLTPSSFKW